MCTDITLDVFSVIIIFMLLFGGTDDRQQESQKRYDNLISSIACILIVNIVGHILEYHMGEINVGLAKVTKALFYLSQVIMSICWLEYIRIWVQPIGIIKERYIPRIKYLVLIAEIILLIINYFTEWIYTIDASQGYIRMKFYLPNYVFACSYAIYTLIILVIGYVRSVDREEKSEYMQLIGFMLAPVTAIFVQAIIDSNLVLPAITLVMIMMYLKVQKKQIEGIKHREHIVAADKRKNDYLSQIFGILADNTQDAYVLFSKEDFVVEYVSPNIERVIGIREEEVIDNLEVFKETIADGIVRHPYESLKRITKDTPIMTERERLNKQTGETIWFRECVYVGELDGKEKLLLVLSDITNEIQTKQALLNVAESAEQANKAKTEFLSDMSHDLRTPMNAIVGLTSLLKADAGDMQKLDVHIGKLEIATNNMLELINNILDMSRIESGKTVISKEPFVMSDVLDEVYAICGTQAQLKGIRFEKEMEIYSSIYEGDALRLKQILLNVLSNSVKYTPSGGSINISLRTVEYSVTGYSMLRFMVEDTGVGMSAEFVEKIFVPFAREANTTTSGVIGTGLGLAIVKNLVDLMGGTIQVESEKNKGSCFIIDLPFRRIRGENDSDEEIDSQKNIAIRGLRMLVVEDNDINAEILLELLEIEGAIAKRAENGQIAVDMFTQSKEGEYEIVLMDVQMPVMNGYEATRAIRACSHPQARTIPILAMTANAFTEDVENAIASGMNAHIAKPIQMELIKKEIAKCLQ